MVYIDVPHLCVHAGVARVEGHRDLHTPRVQCHMTDGGEGGGRSVPVNPPALSPEGSLSHSAPAARTWHRLP